MSQLSQHSFNYTIDEDYEEDEEHENYKD